ncbi:MAG: methionyl-tRNA formyltransferase [Candidatus Tokpelaia sp. JSC085]|nr:MAG: methionyl-tRNA formyltransferase [Candidatus Tokpelaia sp. JSC085]
MVLRLAFMGTPEFAVPVLSALVAEGHEIAAVYSKPARPAGRRGLHITKSPLQREAEKLALPVYTPKTLCDVEEQARFKAFSLDVAVVVAYGLLLPDAVLCAPRLGCFNVHASLLPRWRGAAPIQRSIMAGDNETGVMIIKMDTGLDTGPVAMAERIVIDQNMTSGVLHERLSFISSRLMMKVMAILEQGQLILVPQSEDGVTYAHKIKKDETRIHWDKPATDVHRHICALSPFPGAWCKMEISGKCERVKILGTRLSHVCIGRTGLFDPETLTVSCYGGSVSLTQLQKAGGKPLEAREFMQGATVTAIR